MVRVMVERELEERSFARIGLCVLGQICLLWLVLLCFALLCLLACLMVVLIYIPQCLLHPPRSRLLALVAGVLIFSEVRGSWWRSQ